MVTNPQTAAKFLNLFHNKHYIVTFFAKLWASIAIIWGMEVLQTFRESQNKSKFKHNSSISKFEDNIKKFVS